MEYLSYGVTEKNDCLDEIDFIIESLQINGFTTMDSGYDSEFIEKLKLASDNYAIRYNEKNDVEKLSKSGELNNYRAPAIYDAIFLEVASNKKIADLCTRILGSGYFLNQQNLVINPPQGQQYNQLRFHRDLPYQHYVSSRPLAINTLLAIDDFTLENGATVVVGGTHKFEKFPSEKFIDENRKQIEVKAGTYLILDCMTFHAASHNMSKKNRIGLNHVYSTLMLRPQIDWNRAFSPTEIQQMNTSTRKLLGIGSVIPGNVDEFLENRLNKASNWNL